MPHLAVELYEDNRAHHPGQAAHSVVGPQHPCIIV